MCFEMPVSLFKVGEQDMKFANKNKMIISLSILAATILLFVFSSHAEK